MLRECAFDESRDVCVGVSDGREAVGHVQDSHEVQHPVGQQLTGMAPVGRVGIVDVGSEGPSGLKMARRIRVGGAASPTPCSGAAA